MKNIILLVTFLTPCYAQGTLTVWSEDVNASDYVEETTLSGGVEEATTLSGRVEEETTLSGGVEEATTLSGGVGEATTLSGGVEKENDYTTISCKANEDCRLHCMNRCDVPEKGLESYPDCVLGKCECNLQEKDNEGLSLSGNTTKYQEFCDLRCNRRRNEVSEAVCRLYYGLPLDPTNQCGCRLLKTTKSLSDTYRSRDVYVVSW